MFGGVGEKKIESIVSKAQAARQQRAQEKAREKAALKIQVQKRYEWIQTAKSNFFANKIVYFGCIILKKTEGRSYLKYGMEKCIEPTTEKNMLIYTRFNLFFDHKFLQDL